MDNTVCKDKEVALNQYISWRKGEGFKSCAPPKPRKYSAISHSGGVVLCDSEKGAFLLLRFPEDLENLKKLLDTLEVSRAS